VGEVDCKLGITEMQYRRCVEYICKRITFGLKAFLGAQYFFLCKLNYPCEGFPAQNVTEEGVRLGYIVVIRTKARALLLQLVTRLSNVHVFSHVPCLVTITSREDE
jgi:hypothetical protein